MTDAIVEIRSAVRVHLQQLEAGDTFLVAVSGGADSLALAYALLKEAQPLALRAIAVTIDHQLQSTSADVAAKKEQPCNDLEICNEKCLGCNSTTCENYENCMKNKNMILKEKID